MMKMAMTVLVDGSVVSAQNFDPGGGKDIFRIAAVEGARYVLAGFHGNIVATDVITKRIDTDLALIESEDRPASTLLIIDNFYEYRSELVFQVLDPERNAFASLVAEREASATATPAAEAFLPGAGIGGGLVDVGPIHSSHHVASDGHPFVSSDFRVRADVHGQTNPAYVIVASSSTPNTGTIATDHAMRPGGGVFSMDDVPVVDGLYDDHGAIQGLVANGGYTDDGRPEVVGKAGPGVIVHVYDGLQLLGHSVANAYGDWSFTPLYPLADGRHEISIVLQDKDGDFSEMSNPYIIFVDRIIPAPPIIIGMIDGEGRITGAIADQGITDDNHPVIQGIAEANATVIIYDKGRELARVLVDAEGGWNFTPSDPLPDGLHILSYSTVDAAGNTSERSAAMEFVVDTRPEKVNIYYAEDDVGSVTGEVFNGGTCDDSLPMLFGTATAGGLVRVYEGSMLIGEVAADVDGTWTFTPDSPLSEGAHTFHATISLAAKGESERSSPFNLVVDLTAPLPPSIVQVLDDVGVVTGALEQGGVTDDSMPTFQGQAEVGSKVYVHDGHSLLGIAVADASGQWSYTPGTPLDDGAHYFTATSDDLAGNLSQPSAPFSIIVDTAAPPVPMIDTVYDDQGAWMGMLLMGDETDDYRPDIGGRAEAGSSVIIRDHGVELGRVQADANGNWMFTPDANLAEGSHVITAEAIDAAGNSSGLSDHFDFSVTQNGDDHPRYLAAREGGAISATLVVDTSSSMMGAAMASVRSALKQLATEYMDAAGGERVTLTMLTMSNATPVKYEFSSAVDPGYKAYTAAVNALTGNGGLVFEAAINSAMRSIKADHQAGVGSNQVFIFGDAENSLSPGVADKWQAMLLNPTENAMLEVPIQSTPISFKAFPHAYDYSFHWLATDGKAIDMPAPEIMPEILLGNVLGDVVSGNVLDNDAKLTLDGYEHLTQISFNGGSFRISPKNSLVMTNVGEGVTGLYEPATGLLTIVTENGSLRVYMQGTEGGRAGDYTYKSRAAQLYRGEIPEREIFTYLAVDGAGVSQSASLHIVLQPGDADTLLSISRLGKGFGVDGEFGTADSSAGRELSGRLTQQLAQGLKVQVSVDGGVTWQDAVTHGRSWTFIDMAPHSSSWTIQVRVSDGVTHGTTVLSQAVTLVNAPAAPTIIGIPDAENIYTAALAKDGSEMTVSIVGTGAKVGDKIHIRWGTATYDQELTQVNIENGMVSLNVPASVTYSSLSYSYDFQVTAQVIDSNGAIGARSAPYDVVGTYARSQLIDGLLLAPVDGVYTGNGFTVTTTGSMTQTAVTASSLSGLMLMDSRQANARFILDKPADQIALRLSGAGNALGAKIQVFDTSGSLLYEQTVFGDTSARHLANFNWTKTGVADIGSFTVTAMGASVTLDAFSHYVVTHTADVRDPHLIDVLAETFHGSDGDDLVSLSQYAPTYLGQATAAIHGGGGTDTLKIVGANQVVDMTAAAGKISSMEIIDLTGVGDNTLTLDLSDVLRNGGVDIFRTGSSPRVQMMVKGNAGDKVHLADLLVDGVDHGDWLKQAAVMIGAGVYDVYQHSSLGAELLVQQGITVTVVNSPAIGAASTLGIDISADLLIDGGAELLSGGTQAVAPTSGCERLGDVYPAWVSHLSYLQDVRMEAY